MTPEKFEKAQNLNGQIQQCVDTLGTLNNYEITSICHVRNRFSYFPPQIIGKLKNFLITEVEGLKQELEKEFSEL